MSGDFYRLTEPSVWCTTIDRVSHSSLSVLERCPRQWQLLRSEWPGFGAFPQRRNRGTVEGTLVHEMLDRIFRAMALRGAPRPGTAAFRAVMTELDVMGTLRQEIDAWNAEVAAHPRSAQLHMQTTERVLYNKVAELFQTEYARVTPGGSAPSHGVTGQATEEHAPTGPLALLVRRGVLTEWNVEHPTLPVRGKIDLLRRDAHGTTVVDFKTGAPKPEHRAQLLLFALMWWRSTGDLPVSIELRHPGGSEAFAVDAGTLADVEEALSGRISNVRAALERTPADARTGEHCGFCDVRPFCDAYWGATSLPRAFGAAGRQYLDLEVRVPDQVEANGFVVEDGRRRLPVVWDDLGSQDEPFAAGEVLRIIGARVDGDGVRLTATTEVFRR